VHQRHACVHALTQQALVVRKSQTRNHFYANRQLSTHAKFPAQACLAAHNHYTEALQSE